MDAKNSGLVKTRQAMYGDVTLRCFHATIVVVEEQ
jgi:hypothetical protein